MVEEGAAVAGLPQEKGFNSLGEDRNDAVSDGLGCFGFDVDDDEEQKL